MKLVTNIKSFLEKKFADFKLTRKEFADTSGIPYGNITSIMNELRSNPNIITIIKIADYFNCSVDEVVGRNNILYIKNKDFVFDLSLNVINQQLKTFIENAIMQDNINTYILGQKIDFQYSINNFIRGKRKQNTLSTTVIVALADYYQISIDQIIGRLK